jgi:hypothetical protein
MSSSGEHKWEEYAVSKHSVSFRRNHRRNKLSTPSAQGDVTTKSSDINIKIFAVFLAAVGGVVLYPFVSLFMVFVSVAAFISPAYTLVKYLLSDSEDFKVDLPDTISMIFAFSIVAGFIISGEVMFPAMFPYLSVALFVFAALSYGYSYMNKNDEQDKFVLNFMSSVLITSSIILGAGFLVEANLIIAASFVSLVTVINVVADDLNSSFSNSVDVADDLNSSLFNSVDDVAGELSVKSHVPRSRGLGFSEPVQVSMDDVDGELSDNSQLYAPRIRGLGVPEVVQKVSMADKSTSGVVSFLDATKKAFNSPVTLLLTTALFVSGSFNLLPLSLTNPLFAVFWVVGIMLFSHAIENQNFEQSSTVSKISKIALPLSVVGASYVTLSVVLNPGMGFVAALGSAAPLALAASALALGLSSVASNIIPVGLKQEVALKDTLLVGGVLGLALSIAAVLYLPTVGIALTLMMQVAALLLGTTLGLALNTTFNIIASTSTSNSLLKQEERSSFFLDADMVRGFLSSRQDKKSSYDQKVLIELVRSNVDSFKETKNLEELVGMAVAKFKKESNDNASELKAEDNVSTNIGIEDEKISLSLGRWCRFIREIEVEMVSEETQKKAKDYIAINEFLNCSRDQFLNPDLSNQGIIEGLSSLAYTSANELGLAEENINSFFQRLEAVDVKEGTTYIDSVLKFSDNLINTEFASVIQTYNKGLQNIENELHADFNPSTDKVVIAALSSLAVGFTATVGVDALITKTAFDAAFVAGVTNPAVWAIAASMLLLTLSVGYNSQLFKEAIDWAVIWNSVKTFATSIPQKLQTAFEFVKSGVITASKFLVLSELNGSQNDQPKAIVNAIIWSSVVYALTSYVLAPAGMAIVPMLAANIVIALPVSLAVYLVFATVVYNDVEFAKANFQQNDGVRPMKEKASIGVIFLLIASIGPVLAFSGMAVFDLFAASVVMQAITVATSLILAATIARTLDKVLFNANIADVADNDYDSSLNKGLKVLGVIGFAGVAYTVSAIVPMFAGAALPSFAAIVGALSALSIPGIFAATIAAAYMTNIVSFYVNGAYQPVAQDPVVDQTPPVDSADNKKEKKSEAPATDLAAVVDLDPPASLDSSRRSASVPSADLSQTVVPMVDINDASRAPARLAPETLPELMVVSNSSSNL